MASVSSIVKFTLILLASMYLCMLATLYVFQDSLLFPAPNAEAFDLPEYAQVVEMKTPDGEVLKHIRLRGDEGAPKMMLFHGNGSLAAYELERGRQMHDMGFDVLLVEYRGYGDSTGTPSATTLLQDSLAVYDWYKSDESDWIFLYGHSLGTGIASYVSANRPVQSMVLESPYSKLSDVAADKYPIFPVKLLFKHEIDSISYLKGSSVPTLIIHGELDNVIPIKLGQKLYQSLGVENATWKSLPQAGHNDLLRWGSAELALNHFSKAF